MSLKARLEALEARRHAGDAPARARDALAHVHAPHLARDPAMAGQLRCFAINYAVETHLTASAVVADLAGSSIILDHADAAALLTAQRARAAALHSRMHRNAGAAG